VAKTVIGQNPAAQQEACPCTRVLCIAEHEVAALYAAVTPIMQNCRTIGHCALHCAHTFWRRFIAKLSVPQKIGNYYGFLNGEAQVQPSDDAEKPPYFGAALSLEKQLPGASSGRGAADYQSLNGNGFEVIASGTGLFALELCDAEVWHSV